MRYLADFMDVTCAPTKKFLLEESDRFERAMRMKVCELDLTDLEHAGIINYTIIEELYQSFEEHSETSTSIYIVEDLSRSMIEALGWCVNVDPVFFRRHISDYLWYNTRDPWVELPELDIVVARRNFFHIRYVQPRYFRNEQSVTRARLEAGGFNVLRRIDVEDDHVFGLDEPGSVVGMVRSKVSFWISSCGGDDQGILGEINSASISSNEVPGLNRI